MGVFMVPSGDYFDDEQGPGCGTIVATFILGTALLVVTCFGMNRLGRHNSHVQNIQKQETKYQQRAIMDTVQIKR